MRRSTSVLIALSFLLSAALLITACGADAVTANFSGQVMSPGIDVKALSLPDTTGKTFSMAPAAGRINLVYFGYTNCPDICPTTLSDIRTALKQLGAQASLVTVAMVTIDPNRDVPDKFGGYLKSFITDGVALRTTDAEALRAVADVFGAQYTVTTDAAGMVEVSHSAFLYAIDESGRIRVQWPFGIHGKELATDLRAVIDKKI